MVKNVYITSDNIYVSKSDPDADKKNINNLITQLTNKGVKSQLFGIGPNQHNNLVLSGNVPKDALLVLVFGGSDAGMFVDMASSWYKNALAGRKALIVFMEGAKRITGLEWLERAHDDNYSPASFRGLSHPDQFLRSNGFDFIEGINPNNLKPAVDFIAKAAGVSTSNTPQTSLASVTVEDVISAARVVVEYIQLHNRSPGSVAIQGNIVSMSSFCRMLAATIMTLNTKKPSKIGVKTVADAQNPAPRINNGELGRNDYLTAAQNLYHWIDENGRMPNYITTPLGLLSPFNFLDMYSRALKYYGDKKTLPGLIYVKSVGTNTTTTTTSTVPDSLKTYLLATRNCQVTNSTITSLSRQLKTAEKIFNYVRDNISYLLYYNSTRGAVKTQSDKKGNCCDQTHLLVALARAAGIPARYRHVYGRFGDGKTYGHVYAQVYVNGKWLDADPINKNNKLGVITNWKLVSNINTYRELPF